MADEPDNPRAVIGSNNPPQPEPTPFDLSKTEIEDLYGEAKLWLDGEPVTTQAQADAIAKLITDMRVAEKRADERRTAENEPFDIGRAEVQARYHPLIGKTKAGKGLAIRAIETCKAALDGFLAKQEAEKRAVAEAARQEAEDRRRIAQEALRASDVANLAERQRAEELVQAARAADRAATKAEKDRPAANGGGRAISARVTYRPVLIDARAAARHAWMAWQDELAEFLQRMAERDYRQQRPLPPGFALEEERSVA